ncbi:MAG: endonuclease/exonuclease/phosphatase family protein, partial [Saprospiraceae bacterium]
MDAGIDCFQEIFEEAALRGVIAEADARGQVDNANHIPSEKTRYHRRAIFRKLAYRPYTDASLAFAPNVNDAGPGRRRPGVAILSRMGFVGTPEVIQDLTEPVDIDFGPMGDAGGGNFRLTRLSRPILKVRVPVGEHVVTVFTCHLKSKLGEFVAPADGGAPPEIDLTRYDPVGRALGGLRSALRRMAEAWVLRRAIVAELEAGNPVMVTGDFNDGEHSISSEIITGET